MLSSRTPKSWPKLLEAPSGALRAGARANLFGCNELGGQNNKLRGIGHEKRSRAGSITSHTSANNCKLPQRWMLPHHSPSMSITHPGLLRSQLRPNLDTSRSTCSSPNHQVALPCGKGESGRLAVPMLAATLQPRKSALADPFLFVKALHHLASRSPVDQGGTLDDCHGGASVGCTFRQVRRQKKTPVAHASTRRAVVEERRERARGTAKPCATT